MADIDEIRADMLDEYCQPHDWPWIVGYSGGKDSTLVAHLVFEMLLGLPPGDRRRKVHVVGNDTLVESPLVIAHLKESIGEIGAGADAFGLPVETSITRPAPDQTFWVNLIGRGYPTPKMGFRWCTDRMKIEPTSAYVKRQIGEAGQVVLLLGIRRSESSARAASAKRHDNGERLTPHTSMAGCRVYRPILELDTDEVWEFLGGHEPPWGGLHSKLIGLYRDANGGECPVVTDKNEAASCGTTSSRFGCWTCTVVKKDRSLEGFVESGFEEFIPLLDFRDWLLSIRDDPERRQGIRRNGRVTFTKSGAFVPGPFTVKARMEILAELRKMEEKTGLDLISDGEVDIIHNIWSGDLLSHVDSVSTTSP